MKSSLLVLLVILFTSCATNKSKRKVEIDGERSLDAPEWVHSPKDGCNEESEICASAEGDGQQQADANARNNLASIFETKIKSNFELEKFGYTHAEAEALTERVSSSVTESVETVLNSVEIKDRFQKDGLYFSLASLNKFKAAKTLNQEIKTIDDQLSFLYKEGNKSSILKMHMLFEQREMLNQKIIIITGKSKPTSMSFSKINLLKFKKNSVSKILLRNVNDAPKTLIKWIESLLTEVGYKVIEKANVEYIIRVKLIKKEEFLNVKGFKKFSFNYVMEARNNTGESIGTYSTTLVSTGRNEKDAYLKIKVKLQDEIKSNLNKLNLK